MQDDLAKKRFFVIALMRVAGAVLLMLGMLAVNDKLAWGHGAGVALMVIGLVDFAVMPIVLSRRWRTPK